MNFGDPSCVEESMFLQRERSRPVFQLIAYGALFLGIVLAIVLRVALFHIETSDYTVFVSQWYDFIQAHGGFASFKYTFSNYNLPYLYLIALLTYLPIPKLIAIKALSVLFDCVLGLFTYLILRLRYGRTLAAGVGALAVLLAPTIFINSAAWGQCDSIYAAFCLGSLYFLLKEKPAWACIFFGVALSFKLQAIFFLPLLLVLVFQRKYALRYLLLIPAVFLLLLVPAFVVGRDLGSLLSIYVGQISNTSTTFNGRNGGAFGGGNGGNGNTFGGRGGNPFRGQGGNGNQGFNRGGGGVTSLTSLTLNAPSFYQWFPSDASDSWKWLGIILAALFVGGIGALLVRSKQQVTKEVMLKLAMVFVLVIPFLLPEMHERYFYLADVISILFAFYFPRYFFVAIGVQVCSLLSYAPYLMHSDIVSLSYVAFIELVLGIVVTVDLILTLYPDLRKRLLSAERRELDSDPLSHISTQT